MGVSTDAVIFYGYCWSEEEELIDTGDKEWSELILAKRGETNPWDQHPPDNPARSETMEQYRANEARSKTWREANRAALDAWSAKKRAVQKEFGVELQQHCSDAHSMPYLEIAEAGFMARRGYPEEIDVTQLAVDPRWKGMLDAWLAEFGIEKPQAEPRWWLVSWWG